MARPKSKVTDDIELEETEVKNEEDEVTESGDCRGLQGVDLVDPLGSSEEGSLSRPSGVDAYNVNGDESEIRSASEVQHVERIHRFTLPVSTADASPIVVLPGQLQLPLPVPLPPGFEINALSSSSSAPMSTPIYTATQTSGTTKSRHTDSTARYRSAADSSSSLPANGARSHAWTHGHVVQHQGGPAYSSDPFPAADLEAIRNATSRLNLGGDGVPGPVRLPHPPIPNPGSDDPLSQCLPYPPPLNESAPRPLPPSQNQRAGVLGPQQRSFQPPPPSQQQGPPLNQQLQYLQQQQQNPVPQDVVPRPPEGAARLNPFDIHNEEELGIGHVLKDRMVSLCGNEILANVHFVVGTPEGAVAAGGAPGPPTAGVRTIPAHKCVLVTASSVFYAMFCGSMASRSQDGDQIMVPDVDPDAFMAMLRYIYSEEINLEPESVLPTLYAAKKYMVNPLANECINYLEKNLKPENVCVILMQSKLYDEEELAEKCLREIDVHTEEVLNSEGFLEVDHLTLQSLISRDALSVPEIKLFEAVVRWAAAECLRRGLEPTPTQKRAVLGPVLRMIRIPTISLADFSNHVSKSGLLTAEECVKLFQYFTADDKPGNLDFLCEPRRKVGTERRCRRFPFFLHVSSTFYGLHSIAFKASRKVAIVGFGLYGWAQGCACHVVTAQLMYQGNVIAETHQRITAHCPEDEPTYRVKFDNPVEVNADVLYSACVILNGAQSYYGMDGKDRCEADGVTFTFLNSMDGSNGTNVEHGQIPEIIFTEPH